MKAKLGGKIFSLLFLKDLNESARCEYSNLNYGKIVERYNPDSENISKKLTRNRKFVRISFY